ncbi:hypothetical protein Ptr902_14042 [Pyrenophora tritici-repentis]|nr:hypothetical protein Ptr902_14042 [Pyrenophora tritici-repentis]
MAEPTNEPLATVAETETEQLPRTKEKLDELSQAASIHYATKNFPAAAENYANAVEIQADSMARWRLRTPSYSSTTGARYTRSQSPKVMCWATK